LIEKFVRYIVCSLFQDILWHTVKPVFRIPSVWPTNREVLLDFLHYRLNVSLQRRTRGNKKHWKKAKIINSWNINWY